MWRLRKKEMKINFEDITSMEKVLEIVKPTQDELMILSYKGTEQSVLSCKAWMEMDKVNDVLNNFVIMDFTDFSQNKFYCWVEVVEDNSKPGGFGLSLDDVNYSFTFTYVGARLSFLNEKVARHMFKYFLPQLEAILIKYKQK